MAQVARIDFTRGVLLKAKSVLARCQFLLPGFDLLLLSESVCFQDTVNNLRQLSRSCRYIVDIAFVAFDLILFALKEIT